MTTGLSNGMMTEKNSRNGPAPSTIAASSSSRGIEETNARNNSTQNGMPKATLTRIIPIICLNRPSSCSTQMVGTMAGGTMRPAITSRLTRGLIRD